MGLRFRRSIRIMPGVRLNVSTSGLSATIGPRGASVNVGSRGTYANVGIPGSGLSYRERLDGGTRRSASRGAYRELARELKAQEKAVAEAEAAEEHATHEAVLSRLGNILADRVRAPFPWDSTWASRAPTAPTPFRPPALHVTASTAADQAAKAIPIARWLVPIALLVAVTFLLGSTISRVVAVGFASGAAVWTMTAIRQRRALGSDYLRLQSAEIARDTELLKTDHLLIEGTNEDQWFAAEAWRSRVRGATWTGDVEALAYVLEEELANEKIPVPVIFEIELPSVQEVRLEIALPELDDVPGDKTSITKTGKLSHRAMAQRDRVALYADLCSGLALRLVYETFRVLPMVQAIELFGTGSGVDPATGHPREFVALHLRTSRSELARVNLDGADPSAALSGLGGEIGHDRQGNLRPLTGVGGLDEE